MSFLIPSEWTTSNQKVVKKNNFKAATHVYYRKPMILERHGKSLSQE